MTRYDTTSIHRYLDSVFADAPRTADAQDLKEEMRGNLAARVAELEEAGADPLAATRKAIKELGDVRDIIGPLGTDGAPVVEGRESIVAAHERNKVRPRPGYVVRTVLFSVAIAVSVVAYILALSGGGNWGSAVVATLAVLGLALCSGALVADSLWQETTSNHPLPVWRALMFGGATAFGVAGIGFIGELIDDTSASWRFAAGISLVVASAVLYAYLGATTTNRRKAWMRAVEDTYTWQATPNRLDKDPAAAARFGIYTGVMWMLATGVYFLVSIQWGFAWSWVTFIFASMIQMIMVARSVFPSEKSKDGRP